MVKLVILLADNIVIVIPAVVTWWLSQTRVLIETESSNIWKRCRCMLSDNVSHMICLVVRHFVIDMYSM